MSSISSQIARIQNALVHCLDLQRYGTRGRPIGDVLADIIAISIVRQTDRGLDPRGYRLPKLSNKWLLWKLLNGKNPAILHEDDHMMDVQQVKGIVVISRDAMTMFYGLDDDARDKAYYAQEGQLNARGRLHSLKSSSPKIPRSGWFRPPREFFDMNATSWEKADEYLDVEIDDAIMRLGARRI